MSFLIQHHPHSQITNPSNEMTKYKILFNFNYFCLHFVQIPSKTLYFNLCLKLLFFLLAFDE